MSSKKTVPSFYHPNILERHEDTHLKTTSGNDQTLEDIEEAYLQIDEEASYRTNTIRELTLTGLDGTKKRDRSPKDSKSHSSLRTISEVSQPQVQDLDSQSIIH